MSLSHSAYFAVLPVLSPSQSVFRRLSASRRGSWCTALPIFQGSPASLLRCQILLSLPWAAPALLPLAERTALLFRAGTSFLRQQRIFPLLQMPVQAVFPLQLPQCALSRRIAALRISSPQSVQVPSALKSRQCWSAFLCLFPTAPAHLSVANKNS